MSRSNFWQQLSTPFFLPDIGTFFNQDINLALDLINQLAQAKVSVLKGEILHSADICLAGDTIEKYYNSANNTMVKENYRALIERKVVSLDDYRLIFDHARAQSMAIILSVYDEQGADFAKEIGCMAIKIASANITHQPLIEYIAAKQLPMILDTGHSTLEEVLRAVSWARDAGNYDLLIEHSPPAPPNDVKLHNLRFMQPMGQAAGTPFGLSDHHNGDEMLFAATAMGAIILEKGVCPNNMAAEQDGAHAMPINQVAQTIEKINNIASALGNGYRELPRYRAKYHSRMGLVAKVDIAQGQCLSLANVSFAFPALGIATEYWSEVQGVKTSRDITAKSVINWCDING